MRVLLLCGLGLVFPVVIFLSLTDAPVEMSMAWELAIVNANSKVSANHPTIDKFQILLDRIEEKCSNTRRDIAEVCMMGYLYRKERGSLDTLLEFTQKVDDSIPAGADVAMDLTPLVRAMMGE